MNKPLVSLLNEVHENLLTFNCQTVPKYHGKSPPLLNDNSINGDLEKENPFQAACWCAAKIHLNSLKRGIPFSSDENQLLLEKLRSWIIIFPKNKDEELEREIYIWLCFTGAAVAKKDKTWFLAKVGPTVMSLSEKQLGDFKKGVTRFAHVIKILNDVIT
jgi:hypothetical protein